MGQGAIAQTLTHALQQNRIAPAYLFCGPRGTGKTSSARILAKSLNCLETQGPTPTPCGQCDVCRAVSLGNALDIVEIDAASNTGVDNIRELIERAQFAPVQCRYKVYVIDECHMLSTAAFNALLKTLEEPPDRVVFVLATTDPQRVLPTIISRCQRFDFRRIPLPAMVKHLTYIAQQESIEIDSAAVQLVAQIAQGGLRDAESLLDQLSLRADEITVEAVWDLVGAVPERDLLNLVRAIAADDGTILIERARNLMDKGREPLIVLQSLVGFYRDLLIAKSAPARADMVAITPPTWAEMTEFSHQLSVPQLLASQQKLQSAEVQIKNTTQPRLWLEITLTALLPSALGAIAQVTTVSSSLTKVPDPSVLSVTKAPSISAKPTTAITTAPQTTTVLQTTTVPQTTTAASFLTTPSAHPEETIPLKTNPSAPSEPVAAIPSVATPSIPNPSVDSAAEVSQNALAEMPSPVEEPPSESPEITFGQLDELWAKILTALEPRGTQMLMSQQGSLLTFDGVSAKVGFRSAKLQKMAQQRIPNLEKAFETVFQRSINVLLEVQQPSKEDNSEPKSTAAVSSPPPVLQSRAPQSPPTSQPSVSPLERPAPTNNRLPAPSVDGTSESIEHPAPLPSAAAMPQGNFSSQSNLPQSSMPQHGLPSETSSSPPLDQWATNQDQDNIKRFAQFFNGQIVNLDGGDELLEGSQRDAPIKGSDQRTKKSSDPGPDVPF